MYPRREAMRDKWQAGSSHADSDSERERGRDTVREGGIGACVFIHFGLILRQTDVRLFRSEALPAATVSDCDSGTLQNRAGHRDSLIYVSLFLWHDDDR